MDLNAIKEKLNALNNDSNSQREKTDYSKIFGNLNLVNK